MVKVEKGKTKSILLSLLIVCFIIILNIGTMAKAETVSVDDENKAHITGHNETAEEIPDLIGYDEESAYEILVKHGFTWNIE